MKHASKQAPSPNTIAPPHALPSPDARSTSEFRVPSSELRAPRIRCTSSRSPARSCSLARSLPGTRRSRQKGAPISTSSSVAELLQQQRERFHRPRGRGRWTATRGLRYRQQRSQARAMTHPTTTRRELFGRLLLLLVASSAPLPFSFSSPFRVHRFLGLVIKTSALSPLEVARFAAAVEHFGRGADGD